MLLRVESNLFLELVIYYDAELYFSSAQDMYATSKGSQEPLRRQKIIKKYYVNYIQRFI